MTRAFARMLIIAVLLAVLASITAAQVNPRITTPPGKRPQAAATPEPRPQILEIRCRGGGLQFDIVKGRYAENDLMMNMTIHFKPAGAEAGLTGQSLGPGQCALPDRALSPSEPTEMRAEIINFGQRNRQLHGDPVYKGDEGAERYPDAMNVPPYLSNPNHFWSFFGFNTFDGYFRITNQHYWKPPSALGAGRLQESSSVRPQTGSDNKSGRVKTTSDVVTRNLDPNPIPANAIRAYIRYRKEYGYLRTGGAFGGSAPNSCDAFTVDTSTFVPSSGGFGSNKSVGQTIINPQAMRVEGDYYFCDFTITGLPLNQVITVRAGMESAPEVLTGRWKVGSDPQPPVGSERTIKDGAQNVTLTSKSPYGMVTFEMIYAPIPKPPR